VNCYAYLPGRDNQAPRGSILFRLLRVYCAIMKCSRSDYKLSAPRQGQRNAFENRPQEATPRFPSRARLSLSLSLSLSRSLSLFTEGLCNFALIPFAAHGKILSPRANHKRNLSIYYGRLGRHTRSHVAARTFDLIKAILHHIRKRASGVSLIEGNQGSVNV